MMSMNEGLVCEQQDRVQVENAGGASGEDANIVISNLNVFYGTNQVLKDINLRIEEKEVTVIIGPSGCGKSTLIRVLNRLNDNVVDLGTLGPLLLGNRTSTIRDVDPTMFRTRVGMVFQKAQSIPYFDLRECCIWSQDTQDAPEQTRAGRNSKGKLGKGGTLERSQGKAKGQRNGSFRRSTAATMHREDTCRAAASHPA